MANLNLSNSPSDSTPRVFVSCAKSYAAGVHHGAWIDCDQSSWCIDSEIESILGGESAEWFISDYEGFCGIKISEHQSTEDLEAIASNLAEYGDAYVSYTEEFHCDINGELFQDRYQGEYDSEEDFAYSLWENSGRMDLLKEIGIFPSYIDWNIVTQDIFCGDYISTSGQQGKVHVFSC